MWPGLLILVLVIAFVPLPARAEDRLDLIFAADLEGWFSPRRCAGPPARMGPGLPALSGAIALARTEEVPSLVLGSGLLGSGNLARYLLTREDGGQQAADLLADAGIEVLVPGTAEFSLPPAGLDAVLRALAARGRAPLLSNLRCQGPSGPREHEGRCGVLQRSLILSRGGVRVGLLGVVGESLPRRVGPGHVSGQVQPPAGIAAEIRRLRGATDAVVVVADLEGRGDPGEAVALVQALDAQGAHADVVLATRQDHRSAAVNVVSLSSGALVVGAPAGGAGVAVVSLQRSPEGRLHLSARRVLSGAPDAGLQARVNRLWGEMCRDWGQEVAQFPEGGLSREGFVVRVLDAMRDAGKAEMAMINAGAIDDRGLPLHAASAAEVNTALPYPARVVLLKLSGKDVSERLGKFASSEPETKARQGLILRGLTWKDGALQVNGRPLDPVATYRVSTIDFVSAGGDDLLSPEMAAGRVLHDDLRALVLARFAAAGAGTLPLQELPLWTSNLDFGLDLQGSTIQNEGEARYDRPLLLRKPSVALRIDGTARVQMERPWHLLQLSLRGLYGQTYLAPVGEGEAPTWQETADLINLLALYSFRGLSPRWSIVPTPYASLGLETEWSRPESRGYHHMEISALTGVRTALLSKLSLVLGAGVRSELLARRTRAEEADLARPRVLLSGTLELLKRSLWPRLGNALLGEGTLTYNFTDPQLLRSHELRATGKLYVALGRPLYVTLGLDLYLYGDRGRPPGLSLDVTCGLKVLLFARTQVFSPPTLSEGAKPLPNRAE